MIFRRRLFLTKYNRQLLSTFIQYQNILHLYAIMKIKTRVLYFFFFIFVAVVDIFAVLYFFLLHNL